MRDDIITPELSLIVPMYNESAIIPEFYHRITDFIDAARFSCEIICINDGSRDNTLELLIELSKKDKRIKFIDLSRNFGKEIALTAGLDFSSGDAVIPIDADLQDPPEIILELVKKWREGFDVVYATRVARDGESFIKKFTASLFYRIIGKLSPITIPADTGDFRLLSRQVVEALKEIREHHRFMKGLFSWVGFKQVSVPYHREARFAGKSKFNYWKLWNFAIEGITSFSIVPLQISSYLGFFIAFVALLYAGYFAVNTMLFGNPVPGYPSLMVAVSFFGGAQLMTLGIIGEYLGRMYTESKHRPLYLIRSSEGFGERVATVSQANKIAHSASERSVI